MSSMMSAIVPKSDQLNADDLPAGTSKTIRITRVNIKPGDQPVSINYEGDNGKPYKPCKSMCRVLVNCWGADANEYVGRSATLYCDPTVKWGGMEVGGIRISHLSHIEAKIVLALTVTRGKRNPFVVQPMPDQPIPRDYLAEGELAAADGIDSLKAFWDGLTPREKNPLAGKLSEWKAMAQQTPPVSQPHTTPPNAVTTGQVEAAGGGGAESSDLQADAGESSAGTEEQAIQDRELAESLEGDWAHHGKRLSREFTKMGDGRTPAEYQKLQMAALTIAPNNSSVEQRVAFVKSLATARAR